MPWPRVLVFLYGIFNLGLAIQSYFFPTDKPSPISLITAGTIGILTLVCFAIIPSKPRIGYIGATVLAVLVAGNFAKKALVEGKVYPAGVAFGVSIVVALALTAAHFLARAKSKSEQLTK